MSFDDLLIFFIFIFLGEKSGGQFRENFFVVSIVRRVGLSFIYVFFSFYDSYVRVEILRGEVI